jgi:hypothetical protein
VLRRKAEHEFDKITRDELLAKIHFHRDQFEELLAQLPDEDFLVPAFAGGLSLKDVLAHIVAWEQRGITWVGQAAKGTLPETPGSDEDVDEINAKIYQENKDLTLEEVRAAFARSYTQALALAENTPDEVLFTKNLLEGRKHPFWVTVAANTWWHYKDHYEDLTRWLSERSSEKE